MGRASAQQVGGYCRARVHEMLAVVEHHELTTLVEHLCQRGQQRAAQLLADTQSASDRL